METTKKLNETPLLQEMNDTHSYVVVDDDGNVSRIRDVAKEYVTETELTDFIKPYDERITTNQTDIVNTKTDVLDLETYIDIVTPKNTASGEIVHTTDALPLPTFGTKSPGQVDQFTTKGNQLMDFNIKPSVAGSTATFTNDILTIATSSGYDYTGARYKSDDLIEILRNNAGKQIWFKFDDIELNGTKGSIIRLEGTGLEGQLYSQSTNATTSFTIPETIPDNLVLRFITYNATASTECSMKITKPILYIGTETKPEYEPYTGGLASPNPDYQQPIEMLGAYNLIDIQNNNYVYRNSSDNTAHQNYGNGILIDYDYNNNINYRFAFIKYPFKANKYYCLNAIVTKLGTLNAKPSLYFPDCEQYFTFGQFIKPNKDINWMGIYFQDTSFKEGLKYAITDVILQESDNKNGSSKPYIPYSCVGFKVNNKNFLDLEVETDTGNLSGITPIKNEDGSITITGTATDLWSNITKKKNINLKINKKCCFSINKSVSFRNTIHLVYTDNTYDRFHIESGKTSISFTLSKKVKEYYIYIYNANGLGTLNETLKYQLEYGDTPSNFAIPQEQIVYLDLKGNWVGAINDTIKDYLVTDKKKYWLVKNVGKIVLDGSEGWNLSTNYNAYSFWKANNDLGVVNGRVPKICDNFLYTTQPFDIAPTPSLCENTGQTNMFIFKTDGSYGQTTKEWENWLSTHNTEVYYALSEPQIIELGELPEPIKTFEGVNNIQLLANLDTEIEVVYAQDVKKYIDSKLAEVSSQLL